ncbi:SLC13 family permease [Nocardioides aquiterrae]|uniref:SLC13 family permease n=1 Tax=Nocardioides aquiterrae TaxID=203799 RepID=A0ABP4F4G9_9ACTN
MSPAVLAFAILVVAFAIGSLTRISAGLLAFVGAFAVGAFVADLSTEEVVGVFPGGLFLILVGATLLFGIVRLTGTIDLLAYWAERLAGGRRLLVPVLMFALTAILSSAGAFTPAAIAIVAPVALALGSRFEISNLAMGLVVVQGANAGAFSPVNPFGVLSNKMLDDAGAPEGTLPLYLLCLAFNAVLAVVAYVVVQGLLSRRRRRRGAGATRSAERGGSEQVQPTRVEVTPIRVLTLVGLVVLLVLTTGFGVDVGVATLIIALALIVVRPSLQDEAIKHMPWSAVLLVTGIVTYVGVLEAMGALDELQVAIERLGNGSVAALVACYAVGAVSAFASTTGTLGVISPVVVPIAMDPALTPLGVIVALSISASVVDTSPMSTSGALLMASAEPEDERVFFRALLVWAMAMVLVVPALVWVLFVQLGVV